MDTVTKNERSTTVIFDFTDFVNLAPEFLVGHHEQVHKKIVSSGFLSFLEEP